MGDIEDKGIDIVVNVPNTKQILFFTFPVTLQHGAK